MFTIYGINAITLYVGSGLLARTLSNILIDGIPLKVLIHTQLFASWLSPYLASLAYAVTWIVGWFLALWWMYRRGIVIKV